MIGSTSTLRRALALVVAAAAPLGAQVITDPASPALAGSTVVDFSTLAVGNYTSFTVSDVTFAAALGGETVRVGAPGEGGGPYGPTGQHLQNNFGGTSTIRFDFGSPVSAFGFVHGAADLTWNLFAYDADGALLASTPVAPTGGSRTGGFIGLQSTGAGIAYATYTTSGSDWVLVDDFEYVSAGVTATPEPATLGLLGTGLVGLAAFGRRRRGRATA